MKNLETLSCNTIPRTGGQSIHKATSIPFVICDDRDRSTGNGMMSLHVTKSPRPSPSAYYK